MPSGQAPDVVRVAGGTTPLDEFLFALSVLDKRSDRGPFSLSIFSDGSGQVLDADFRPVAAWSSYDNHVTDGERIGAIYGAMPPV